MFDKKHFLVYKLKSGRADIDSEFLIFLVVCHINLSGQSCSIFPVVSAKVLMLIRV